MLELCCRGFINLHAAISRDGIEKIYMPCKSACHSPRVDCGEQTFAIAMQLTFQFPSQIIQRNSRSANSPSGSSAFSVYYRTNSQRCTATLPGYKNAVKSLKTPDVFLAGHEIICRYRAMLPPKPLPSCTNIGSEAQLSIRDAPILSPASAARKIL